MAVAVTTGYSGHSVRFPGSLAANYPPCHLYCLYPPSPFTKCSVIILPLFWRRVDIDNQQSLIARIDCTRCLVAEDNIIKLCRRFLQYCHWCQHCIFITVLISKLRNTSVPWWMSELWRVLRQYNWATPLPLKYIADITFAQLELSNAWTQETWNLISWCGTLKTETTLKVKQKLSWNHTKNMNITHSSNTFWLT